MRSYGLTTSLILFGYIASPETGKIVTAEILFLDACMVYSLPTRAVMKVLWSPEVSIAMACSKASDGLLWNSSLMSLVLDVAESVLHAHQYYPVQALHFGP